MKNTFFIIVFLLAITATVTAATIISVNPATIIPFKEATITGTDFALTGEEGQICWNDKCLSEDSIKSWSNTEIIFEMNTTGMDLQGALQVVFKDPCLYKNGEVCVADWNTITGPTVTVAPFVETLTVNQKIYYPHLGNAAGLKSGQTIELQGDYFGDQAGAITFGSASASISSWSNKRITLTVPPVDSLTETFIVNNKYANSEAYPVNLNKTFTNDPYLAEQLYLTYTNYWKAWESYPQRGKDIVVAVIDSGINWNHEDFIGNIALNTNEIKNNQIDDDNNGYIDDYYGYNFEEDSGNPDPANGHGSMVAGIIAAKANNSVGTAGIAPEAKIMPLIACAEECLHSDIIEAIDYAIANGADIINLSLGGTGTFDDFTTVFDEPFQRAYEKGVIIVAAAGNGDFISQGGAAYGRNLNNAPNSPVCNQHVIGVASIESDQEKSTYSDYGSDCIEVSAYGSQVTSLSHPGFSTTESDYDIMSGTSFAAPQVSGALAILLSKNPDLTPWEAAAYLQNSGDPLESKNEPQYKSHISTGLNIHSLLKYTPAKGELPAMQIAEAWIEKNTLYIEGDFFAKNSTLTLSFDKDTGKTDNSFSTSIKNSFVSSTLAKISLGKIDLSTDQDQKINIKLERYDKNEVKLTNWTLTYKETSDSDQPQPAPNDETQPQSENPFPDLPADHKNYTAILYLKSINIIGGYPDGTFKPENTVNRAELLKILIGGKGIFPTVEEYNGCFPDVTTEWFAPYICFAKQFGWIQGYPDGTFKPAQTVNKVEAVKILLNSQEVQIPLAVYAQPFADVPLTEWFAPYIFKAKELNILEETGQFLGPADGMTRGSISENLYRLLTLP